MRIQKQYEGPDGVSLRFITLAAVALLVMVFSAPSYAHNLWIVGDADDKGVGTVHLYFEHFVGPGDGSYLGPIEKNGKTWVRTPDGRQSIAFCTHLLEETGIVATPGVGFGEHGEGYFRLSITADTETVRSAGAKLEGLGSRPMGAQGGSRGG